MLLRQPVLLEWVRSKYDEILAARDSHHRWNNEAHLLRSSRGYRLVNYITGLAKPMRVRSLKVQWRFVSSSFECA